MPLARCLEGGVIAPDGLIAGVGCIATRTWNVELLTFNWRTLINARLTDLSLGTSLACPVKCNLQQILCFESDITKELVIYSYGSVAFVMINLFSRNQLWINLKDSQHKLYYRMQCKIHIIESI